LNVFTCRLCKQRHSE